MNMFLYLNSVSDSTGINFLINCANICISLENALLYVTGTNILLISIFYTQF